MNDLRSRLTQDDPLLRERDLSGAESHRLRERILAAKPASTVSYSKVMFPIAAMLLFVAVGSGWWVRSSVPDTALALEPSQVRPRQLQFSTPGGTRVIWTLNDNFELR
jgi:hypothetical protein